MTRGLLSTQTMEVALRAITADLEDYGRGEAVEGNLEVIAAFAAAGAELEELLNEDDAK